MQEDTVCRYICPPAFPLPYALDDCVSNTALGSSTARAIRCMLCAFLPFIGTLASCSTSCEHKISVHCCYPHPSLLIVKSRPKIMRFIPYRLINPLHLRRFHGGVYSRIQEGGSISHFCKPSILQVDNVPTSRLWTAAREYPRTHRQC